MSRLLLLWPWVSVGVAVADLVPLLYVLPCAAMMFVCMKGMSHGQQADTSQNFDSERRTHRTRRPELT